MTIKWYSEALDDLDQIYEFYEMKNPKAAVLLCNEILDDADILQTHPYYIEPIEQALDDCQEGYRSLVAAKGRYKIVYYVVGDSVFIVQILSRRQDIEKFKR